MIERQYMSISNIYKLPIMDFSLYYTKIVMSLNKQAKKNKDNQKKKGQGKVIR